VVLPTRYRHGTRHANITVLLPRYRNGTRQEPGAPRDYAGTITVPAAVVPVKPHVSLTEDQYWTQSGSTAPMSGSTGCAKTKVTIGFVGPIRETCMSATVSKIVVLYGRGTELRVDGRIR
jgi:hypothetical protein